VQITNCPATVSNANFLPIVVHCRASGYTGRTVKMLQVRRPAFAVLAMLSWNEANSQVGVHFNYISQLIPVAYCVLTTLLTLLFTKHTEV